MLPAVFSKAEMATAMPQAGGTYLYIDRAMGPLLGTVAGFGVWFSLTFKSAFALVGLSAYLSLFIDVDPRLVGLIITFGLIGLNLLGLKQSTALQTALVIGVMAVLVGFVVLGVPDVESTPIRALRRRRRQGIVLGAAVVFVSYAGVTKIASIAEEVRRPSAISRAACCCRSPDDGALSSSHRDHGGRHTPCRTGIDHYAISTAASHFLGDTGEFLLAGTAVIALISMGNAGLVASARYPFAMSRNRLAPSFLSKGRRSLRRSGRRNPGDGRAAGGRWLPSCLYSNWRSWPRRSSC